MVIELDSVLVAANPMQAVHAHPLWITLRPINTMQYNYLVYNSKLLYLSLAYTISS